MSHISLRFLIFLIASTIQVHIADAKEYILPVEDPKDCLKIKVRPCSLSTGDRPRMFQWENNLWELDRNLVMQTKKTKLWNLYQGMGVVDAKENLQIHTPFADIYLGKSKVMIHVFSDKVRILSLGGEGVRVIQKGSSEEQFLVPGFQNWYGGVVNGKADSGVVSVIDFDQYSQDRAPFFMNHQLGFPKELKKVASHVKWAAKIAADFHRQLVERKMASLEQQHQEKVLKKRRKIEFNKYLRRLFLKKIRYDY